MRTMARPRLLRIGAVAVLLILATLVALVVALVIADERAGTARTCNVVAFLVDDDPLAVNLTLDVLARHPEIAQALARVEPPTGGVASLPCERLDDARADIEALGAPPSASGDYIVRHDGRAYALTLTLAVA